MVFSDTYTFAGHLRWNLGWPNPNYAGAFIATLTPWVWARTKSQSKSRSFRSSGGIALAFAIEIALLFGLTKTYSRGAVVAFLAAALYFVFVQQTLGTAKQSFVWFASRVLVLAFFSIANGFYERVSMGYMATDKSIGHRLELWLDGLKMVASAPVHGWGAGESGRAYMNWFQPISEHDRFVTMVNSYLHIATEYGVPSLVLFLFIMLFFVRPIEVEWRESRWPKSVAACSGATWVAWAAANAFTTLWIEPKLWIVPGVAGLLAFWATRENVTFASYQRHLVKSISVALIGGAIVVMGAFICVRFDANRIRRDTSGLTFLYRSKSSQAEEIQAEKKWEIWPDARVLGADPGKELRHLADLLPGKNRMIVHPLYEPTKTRSQGTVLFFFGRTAERLDFAFSSSLQAREIWIVHPVDCVPPMRPFPETRLMVVLPEIDQFGQNPLWIAWAAHVNAEVILTPSVGLDICSRWPEALIADHTHITVLPKSRSSPGPAAEPAKSLSRTDDSMALSPAWRKIQADMGGVFLNGNCRQNFNLGSSSLTERLGIRFRMEHRLAVDSFGRAGTEWTFIGLQTSLTPDADGGWCWQTLWNETIRFSALSGEFGKTKSFSLVQDDPVTFRIRNAEGVEWVYRSGVLESIKDPLHGEFSVKTCGGLVAEIAARDQAQLISILRAEYNARGEIQTLALGAHQTNSFYWADGRLIGWKHNHRPEMSFSYRDGLISEISDGETFQRTFTWEKNSDFLRGDSRWPQPVHLSADENHQYEFNLCSNGISIRVIDRRTSQRCEFIYNPLRHRLSYRGATGDRLLVRLKKDAVRQIPEFIENESGAIVQGNHPLEHLIP
jgi:hypothetical protein